MATFNLIPSLTKYNRFLTGVAVFALLMYPLAATATSSSANESEPASWELSLPGENAPATAQEPSVSFEFEETIETTSASNNASNAPAANTSAARNNNAADPCPDPRVAKNSRPDDLAKVQEDIDRFSLCVQRAQLLERLNESSILTTKSADKVLGLETPNNLPTGGAMPPLPANSMGFDVEPRTETAPAPSATPAANAPAATASTNTKDTAKAADAQGPAWSIREIFGSVTDMQARLLNAQGDEILVRQGFRLSDGAVVTTITPSGVTVRDASGVKSLEWSGN